MEVILLERVRNVGQLGDMVAVKPGYARNFLIPQGKAVAATEANRADFEARRAELEKQEAEQVKVAKARAEKLDKQSFTVEARVSDDVKLYGAIGTREVADIIVAAGHELEKSEVILPEGGIRETGEHTVRLQLHSDVGVDVVISVVAQEQ